ncbi:ester cyclase [Rubrivirga sp. IMCC43871]|uniref:ester cyclase n=1 Tax=Rubrivirga sp. IMCC43871 TaxID=3391575 RepID=UPI00398FC485
MSDRQTNLDQQERWGAAVTSGHLDGLDEVLAPDFVDHDSGDYPGTREGLKAFFTDFRTAFPDLDIEVEHMNATDEYVSFRYTVTGTHRGEFKGHAPTGKTFSAPAMQMGRWENGRCVERWGTTNEAKILSDLGLIGA